MQLQLYKRLGNFVLNLLLVLGLMSLGAIIAFYYFFTSDRLAVQNLKEIRDLKYQVLQLEIKVDANASAEDDRDDFIEDWLKDNFRWTFKKYQE